MSCWINMNEGQNRNKELDLVVTNQTHYDLKLHIAGQLQPFFSYCMIKQLFNNRILSPK
jgi:hypothetical protein